MTADKHLQILEQELRFIARHVQTIDGTGADFDKADELAVVTNSALRALAEYNLSLQPDAEAVPAGVALPEAAGEPQPLGKALQPPPAPITDRHHLRA